MFDNWKEQRKAIKKHILKIYDGTNSQNKSELDRFLEFIISNYDLDDNIFEQIKEDLDVVEDDDHKSIQQIEDEEYRYNVLRSRCLWSLKI